MIAISNPHFNKRASKETNYKAPEDLASQRQKYLSRTQLMTTTYL
jgi:hypothetical protein